ncbi:MAG TPA: surface-adhesin E family protein [Methylophilaceae bacterium]|jgi:hypothetical protein
MLIKLVGMMFLCASANVLAAEWVALPAIPNGDQYYYDKSKLVIKDDDVTFWKKVQFKSPQSLKGTDVVSGVLRERINCADHTAKLLTYLYYSASGETVEYVPQDETPAMPIVPDTVGDNYDRVLCPMVWRKQEEARIKNEQKAAEQEMKDDSKPKDTADDKPSPSPSTQRSALKPRQLELTTTPPPKMPPGALPNKMMPNAKMPDAKLPDSKFSDKVIQQLLPLAAPPQQTPLPDPQIMEQLY